MNIDEFCAMRSDPDRRNDFLAGLAVECLSSIRSWARRMIGKYATEDLIRGEATQRFLLKANAAIDTAKLHDDGRDKNDPVEWCKFKGLHGMVDWLRVEYGTRTRAVKTYNFRSNLVYAEDVFKHALFQSKSPWWKYADHTSYENAIVSTMTVREFIENLEPVDQSIVALLVFGADQFGTIRCAGVYGAATRRTAADVALTIGRSESYVYNRLQIIRREVKERLLVA